MRDKNALAQYDHLVEEVLELKRKNRDVGTEIAALKEDSQSIQAESAKWEAKKRQEICCLKQELAETTRKNDSLIISNNALNATVYGKLTSLELHTTNETLRAKNNHLRAQNKDLLKRLEAVPELPEVEESDGYDSF